MIEIIILESLATLLFCTFTICFWTYFGVPEKIFCTLVIILMCVLVTKNTVSYVTDPLHDKQPTLEDVHNGNTTVVSDTTIRQSVYWNEELK